MVIRSAQFIGSVATEHQSHFNAVVDGPVRAHLAAMPGLHKLEILRPLEMDAGARPIYQIYNLVFADTEAMRAALNSPVRDAVHAAMAPILPLFDGDIVHYVWSIVES